MNKKSIALDTVTLQRIFLIFFCFNLAITAAMVFASRGASMSAVLFGGEAGEKDFFMDFLNAIRSASSKTVYVHSDEVYPPLFVVLFKVLGLFLPASITGLDFDSRYKMQGNQLCMLMFVMVFAVCLVFLYRLPARRYVRAEDRSTVVPLLVLMLLSYPVIYCVERGNIAMFVLLLVMFWLWNRSSEKKNVRLAADIAFACAVGLAIWPVVFILIPISERRFKEIKRPLILSACVTVLPLLVIIIIDSLISEVSLGAAFAASAVGIGRRFAAFFVKSAAEVNMESFGTADLLFFIFGKNFPLAASAVICFIFEILAAVAVFFTDKLWLKTLLIAYLALNLPGGSSVYMGVLLIIPLYIWLFEEKDRRPLDLLPLLFFIMLISPLPPVLYLLDGVRAALGDRFTLSLNKLVAPVVLNLGVWAIAALNIISSRKKAKTVNADTEK